jgi:hypothetical protein
MMVDTPRDGRAWCDTVNTPKPWAACYLRVAMDESLGYRYEGLTPTESRRRAEDLIADGEKAVSVHQSRGGKMELVAVLYRERGWEYRGAWADADSEERRDDPGTPVRLRIKVRADGSEIMAPQQ